MFPLAPLSIIGQALASPVVGSLASAAAAGALRAFGESGQEGRPAENFSELVNRAETHGNGWLTQAGPPDRPVIAGGRLLSGDPEADGNRPRLVDQTTAQARFTPAAPAQMLLASEAASGSAIATAQRPQIPMGEAIRACYAALRAAR